jgi:hypothetical protein
MHHDRLDGENRCYECNILCYENELIGDVYWCKECFNRSWHQYMKKQRIPKWKWVLAVHRFVTRSLGNTSKAVGLEEHYRRKI